MARDDHQLKFRVPDGLKQRIEAAARKSGRSLNSEIIGILETAFPQRPSTREMLPELEKIIARLRAEPDRLLAMGVQYDLYSLIVDVQALGLFDGDIGDPNWDPFGPITYTIDLDDPPTENSEAD